MSAYPGARDRRLVAVVLATAGALMLGVYVARHTEWVERETADPVDPRWRRDPMLQLKQLLTRTGAALTNVATLDRLPPEDATLVLDSVSWNLFSQRESSLRLWVESGGALVLTRFPSASPGLAWVPVRVRDDASANITASTPERAAAHCPDLHEPNGVAPAFGVARRYVTCFWAMNPLESRTSPAWALDAPGGHVVIRVPYGRGSVTVAAAALPWTNGELLDHDNGLIAIAVTQSRPGRSVWLVTDEARAPLLAVLWQRGAPAALLAAVALGFALWRSGTRFGPPLAPVPKGRRSMAEQVRGTAQFIARSGSAVLHRAQTRALAEVARRCLPRFDALAPDARADAIAAAAGIDPPALRAALFPSPGSTRRAAAALALLETARRELRARAGRSHRPPDET